MAAGFCVVAEELAAAEGFPTAEQATSYASLAPDAIHGDAEIGDGIYGEHEGDDVALFVAMAAADTVEDAARRVGPSTTTDSRRSSGDRAPIHIAVMDDRSRERCTDDARPTLKGCRDDRRVELERAEVLLEAIRQPASDDPARRAQQCMQRGEVRLH